MLGIEYEIRKNWIAEEFKTEKKESVALYFYYTHSFHVSFWYHRHPSPFLFNVLLGCLPYRTLFSRPSKINMANFAKFLRTPFLTGHLRCLLLLKWAFLNLTYKTTRKLGLFYKTPLVSDLTKLSLSTPFCIFFSDVETKQKQWILQHTEKWFIYHTWLLTELIRFYDLNSDTS